LAPDHARETARLHIANLSKNFGSTVVLDRVELCVQPGEIHGLIGQNGSGKSTLVKIMTGYHNPDRGSRMEVDGQAVPLPPRPRDLLAAGISFVHQDLGLIDHLTVADNICVGQFECSRFARRIDARRQAAIAEAALDRLGISLSPRALVASLTPAQRASVAIARGLLRQQPGAGVVLLDESTRALPPDGLLDVHQVLRRIVADGGSVLLVSHNLSEVMSVTDRVTVLRDGRVVAGSVATSQVDQRELARLMLGFDLASSAKPKRVPSTVAAAVVRGLSGTTVRDLDLVVRAGEIVGLTGLPGSGYEEVPYLLSGAGRCQSGALELNGRTHQLNRTSINALRRAGVALVPERRDRDGLALEMSVADNITVPRLVERGRRTFTGMAWRQEEVESVITRLGVKPSDPLLLARQLSGGNQQKVVLGKWLEGSPSLLVLHEPTQAVDVSARNDILDVLRAAAASGLPIICASMEAGDLAAICHRILIFTAGRVSGTVTTDRRDDVIEEIYAGQLGRSESNLEVRQ
jgi:ribose transport system ATP-binding protein